MDTVQSEKAAAATAQKAQQGFAPPQRLPAGASSSAAAAGRSSKGTDAKAKGEKGRGKQGLSKNSKNTKKDAHAAGADGDAANPKAAETFKEDVEDESLFPTLGGGACAGAGAGAGAAGVGSSRVTPVTAKAPVLWGRPPKAPEAPETGDNKTQKEGRDLNMNRPSLTNTSSSSAENSRDASGPKSTVDSL